ncbi:MAG: type 1 glutamine amidotransferase [Alphaproteobacteria bacterium]
MSAPRLLVCEGNTAELRARQVAAGGVAMSDGYADVLRTLLPGAVVDVCYPADPGANLPIGGLEGYDGVAITGSALNVYDGGSAIEPQIELARAVLKSRTPLFGSCWGLQVVTVAAGGTVRPNPKGRELAIGRRIALTRAGRDHPMYAGKAPVFDAVTVHLDEVETLAPGSTVLATNGVSDVQAAEIRADGGVAWTVQYHPEFSLYDMAVIVRRYGRQLIKEGFFADEAARDAYIDDLRTLDRDPASKPLAWRYGIDETVLNTRVRTAELANWITHQVLPTKVRRGRN